jgi:hypothetical protein
MILAGVSLLSHVSCSDNPTAPVPTTGTIKISIKSVGAGLGKASSLATITSARVVIEEIEFESSLGDTLDFELEQPFVQDLISGSTLHEIETVEVPFGSYKESEIEIDELDPEDGAVYSVVKGYLNGDPNNTFIFTSDLEEEQEREFEPPLVLNESEPSTSIVLAIDMGMWLVDGDGNLLDPSFESNRSMIEGNIKASIDVFEDEDDDGEEDD